MQALVELRSYPPEIGHHQHDFDQIILPCDGVMELETDRGNGRVNGGVAAFIAAGDRHSFAASDQGRFIVLDLPEGLHQTAPAFFHIDPALRGLLDYFHATGTTAPHAAWSTLVIDRLTAVLPPANRDKIAIQRALTFMRDHLDQPSRVEDIARAAGLSVSRLHRLMRTQMQTTPHGCLAALRLDRAEALLAEGHLSIAEIALATGHADQSALTRALKRERGTTPARFRRMLHHGS